jgi:hypothetical protein
VPEGKAVLACRKFSNVTLRDARGSVVARERLDHVARRPKV